MADRIVILDKGRVAQVGEPEEIYNRPNSPFVADFMGAGNVVRLTAERVTEGLAIAEGPHNAAVTIAVSALRGDALARFGAGGTLIAHFRGEAAQLRPDKGAAGGALTLRGRIAQASYPGGTWRYSVAVGADHFLVDDDRRLAVGASVGIALPVETLHLYRVLDKP